MENYRLSEKNLNELRHAHKKTKEKWLADRIKAVFLLGSGWSVGDVAEVLMMDEKTVRNHFQTWESGGVDALKQRLYRGRVARLTPVQKERLSTWLDENLCLNVGEILQYLRKMYGVFLSRSHMCRLLREPGFVYKKPKHVLAYRQLRENASENEVFYFGDGCH
ncbi:MAG: winged helix-turn-helix domain-containing protein, partial [Planctomycetia bacterium]|nr:winged helix-turn-helix domain-containing protein [Planctomycetia bacterium]